MLSVKKENNQYIFQDKVNWEQEKEGELKTVFKNGKLIKDFTLSEIRNLCLINE